MDLQLEGLAPPCLQSGPMAKVQPPNKPTPMPTMNQPPSALAETQLLAISLCSGCHSCSRRVYGCMRFRIAGPRSSSTPLPHNLALSDSVSPSARLSVGPAQWPVRKTLPSTPNSTRGNFCTISDKLVVDVRRFMLRHTASCYTSSVGLLRVDRLGLSTIAVTESWRALRC